MDLPSWLFSEKFQQALAGAMGGVVRSLSVKERSLWDTVVNVTVGSICAMYVSPMAGSALDPLLRGIVAEPSARSNFVAFAIGLGGLTVSSIIIDVWRRYRRAKKESKDDS